MNAILRRHAFAQALCLSVLTFALVAEGKPETTDGMVKILRQAQEKVAAEWSYDVNLVCASAGKHGLIEKAATAMDIADALFIEKPVGAANGREGLPMYVSTQIFMSKKYKFIYVRQPKSSSTSLIRAMEETFCKRHVCTEYEFVRIPSNQLISDDQWSDYFVFTVVRNPIARMISTYNMFKNFLRTRIPNDKDVPKRGCILPFDEFAQDVYRLHTNCDEKSCCAYMSSSGWIPGFAQPHIQQQAHSIFTTKGKSVVDFIGRTENIDTDWMEIVGHITKHSGQKVKPSMIENVNGHHLQADLPAAERHLCLMPDVVKLNLINETTVMGLVKQFAIDMVWLDFTMESVEQREEDAGEFAIEQDDTYANDPASKAAELEKLETQTAAEEELDKEEKEEELEELVQEI